MEQRIEKLAKLLVNYSCRLQPKEKILIEYTGTECEPLIRQIVKEVYIAGGYPYVNGANRRISREILLGASDEQLKFRAEYEMAQMKGMDAYIAVREDGNVSEYADVPAANLSLYERIMSPVLDERVDHTKWVILRYPNGSMAQLAQMSQEAFEDFFFDVCTLDYGKMARAMDPLVDLMNHTDKVHILGPDTDLTFSIAGIPAVKCAGECNIPDGEVYTAPVRESMNGHIHYNTRSLEAGFVFSDIRFDIENGKIVKAAANDDERINHILDTDEGARYFGEFSFGLNPYVQEPMLDTLFDEKINGSFHLTPGMCYEDAPNGNKSAVHWDLVMIQRPEHGGGISIRQSA